MATHSSILAFEIPWTEKPRRSPWGRKRVGHDLVTTQQQQCIAIIVYFDPYIIPILS